MDSKEKGNGGGVIDNGKKDVVGIMVDAIDYEGALTRILTAAEQRRSFLVSALAVHGVMTGVEDAGHKFRLNSFDLIVPDGQPVRWALNLIHKSKLCDRVYGPELTIRTINMAAKSGLPVYFYGTTPAILDRLVQRLHILYPTLVIAGSEPSKFRSIDNAERKAVAERIMASGARIVFVGLGCPRQEVFSYEMRDYLPMPLIAVGAAFAFIAGELAQAPPTMQRYGLEWIFRLKEEPRRLWRRYLYLNPYYAFLLIGQFVGVKFPNVGEPPSSVLGPG